MNIQDIGKNFNKKFFGIKFPANLKSDQIVKGELYSFFNDEGGTDDNIREQDGFVYEVHANYQLIPPGKETNLHRHIFVRKKNTSDFEYLGESVREENFSSYQNKAFFAPQQSQLSSSKDSNKFEGCILPK